MKNDKKKILGLIGIRSGSTGVKNKNIKKLEVDRRFEKSSSFILSIFNL